MFWMDGSQLMASLVLLLTVLSLERFCVDYCYVKGVLLMRDYDRIWENVFCCSGLCLDLECTKDCLGKF